MKDKNIVLTCEQCENDFYALKSYKDNHYHYLCSRPCIKLWKQDNPKEKYILKVTHVKMYDYKCANCGKDYRSFTNPESKRIIYKNSFCSVNCSLTHKRLHKATFNLPFRKKTQEE